MRLTPLFLALTLAACAKGPTDATEDAARFESLSAPASCSFIASGPHDFLEWHGLDADTYSCPDQPLMNCTLALNASDGRREMVCLVANPAFQPNIPAGCNYHSDANHVFLDGFEGWTYAYNCGVIHNNIQCFFYNSGANHNEMRCLDNQLPN